MLILLCGWSRAQVARQEWKRKRVRGPNLLSLAHLVCKLRFMYFIHLYKAIPYSPPPGSELRVVDCLRMSSLRAVLHHLCGTPSSNYTFPTLTVRSFDQKHTLISGSFHKVSGPEPAVTRLWHLMLSLYGLRKKRKLSMYLGKLICQKRDRAFCSELLNPLLYQATPNWPLYNSAAFDSCLLSVLKVKQLHFSKIRENYSRKSLDFHFHLFCWNADNLQSIFISKLFSFVKLWWNQCSKRKIVF